MSTKIKHWLQDHHKAVIGISVCSIFVGLILFLAIPVTETMKVKKVQWSWDIPVYIYTMHNEERWYSAPDGAYDIRKKYEYHYSETVKIGEWKDNNGVMHDITESRSVYDWKYYYKINIWDFSYDLNSTGFDKKPHEAECKLESIVPKPSIGDKKRGGHKESYYIYGDVDSSEEVKYELDKEDWKTIDVGGMICYKKFRYGDKIWDIDFVKGE